MTPLSMPEHLRKRQQGGEEARFTWVFYECLRLSPDKAPSPTAINRLRKRPPPLNQLAGRDSTLRRKLLLKNGFKQHDKGTRWFK